MIVLLQLMSSKHGINDFIIIMTNNAVAVAISLILSVDRLSRFRFVMVFTCCCSWWSPCKTWYGRRNRRFIDHHYSQQWRSLSRHGACLPIMINLLWAVPTYILLLLLLFHKTHSTYVSPTISLIIEIQCNGCLTFVANSAIIPINSLQSTRHNYMNGKAGQAVQYIWQKSKNFTTKAEFEW